MSILSWEALILRFVQAAAPAVENLFIHKPRSIAIFNASDQVFNGVVDIMTQQATQQASTVAPPPAAPAAVSTADGPQ